MSKEHAYAYEAGYRDGSINYELEHCPACKNVADLQEALADNAKLRDGAYAMRQLYEDELKHALADNAKLQELCATVIDDWMSKVCPSFPFCEFGGEYQGCTDETCGNQIYRQMARELGVDE